MQKALLTLLVSIATSFGSISYAQGIPTIDAAAIAQQLQQLITLKQQVENQVSQIVELKNQVQALTSVDNLKGMTEELASQQIPDSWKDLYKDISSVSDADINKILNPSLSSPAAADQLLVGYFKQIDKSFSDINERYKRLINLQSRLRSTKDIKAAADIQNQIAVENGAIQVSQTKLDNIQRMFNMQKEIIIKKQQAISACLMDKWAKGEEFRDPSICQ